MAQSRLERIGTIYSRTQSLLRGGAMKQEDKPLWYVVYEAFPPKVEPRFDREAPKIPIRQIFYKEDVVRAKFQEEHKRFLSSNLFNAKSKSSTQQFLAIYKEMEESGTPEDELYSKAIEAYKIKVDSLRQLKREAAESKDKASREDPNEQQVTIDLKKVFD